MSPPIVLCALKTAPRKQRAWDVVHVSEASPMPIYYEGHDIVIVQVSPESITGQYTFDMRSKYQSRKALQAARIQLIHEIKKDRYNMLLGEA
ncbi:hypothetical protein RhiXN_00560 [Rhizoctonia solani]|uniref:Uncharacterized protein n=1 Tax=Rhizoctonia solani TaxID=456999 RepID=A0A8H8SVC0_9AGAM|nr:uncharacterized protein RhiXN_00560 [Rhizoctonia solani]QRW19154.1 hypothetical protein RhiXN_00560 [Rhizoctonia solani]